MLEWIDDLARSVSVLRDPRVCDSGRFVLTDLSVSIPGQSVTHASYVARHAGIFDFICDIPAHLPMMRGQLVVLRRERATP